ncbi:MAG TPA: T9SS type A sorting domain-containing protein [Prolixibacteraceae bacterium]|nr:T9SS type A sorting domain-containing protein [Prolixibacteraceae bacterium]
MKRRLIFLLLIFSCLSGFSQVKRDLQYYASLCEIVPFNNVKFWSSGMSYSKTDYWYSLNASPIQSVYDVIVEDIYPVVILKDLKLNPDINLLRIYYWDGSKYQQFNDTMYYVHPELKLNGVTQNNVKKYLTDGYYLIQKDQEVSVDFEAAFPTVYRKPAFRCNSSEAEKITRVEYKFNTDPWKPAPAPKGVMKISSFLPGLNTLVVRYGTGVNSNYPKDTLYFFRTWFELDPLFNSAGEVWKKDTVIKLNGYPSGGWFTGNGIEGSSVWFNPAKAGLGKHLLTYHFPFRGKDLMTSDTVRVLAYDFTLSGPQSVCANSSNVDYTIGNCINDFTYTWNLTGGSLASAGNCKGTIKWNDKPGIGIVKVTATHKISRYSVEKYMSVYKTSNQAYPVPSIFFGDIDNRLVISSFADAYEYSWIPDGQSAVVSKSPFYYFSTPIKSSVTLLLKTEKGCESQATITLPNKASSSVAAVGSGKAAMTGLKQASLLFPNPAFDQINILVDDQIGELQEFSIYDAKSNLVINRSLKALESREYLRVDVSGLLSGWYIAVLKGTAGSRNEKFMVTK